MKIFLSVLENGVMGKQLKQRLIEDITNKGYEIVRTMKDAEELWVQVSSKKYIPNIMNKYRAFEGNIYCFLQRNNEIKFYNYKEVEKEELCSYRTFVGRKPVSCNISVEQRDKLTIDIINYLLGKVDKIDLLDPFPFDSLIPLALFNVNKTRDNKEPDYRKLIVKYNLKQSEVDILADEIQQAISFKGDSNILQMVRCCKEIYTEMLPFAGVRKNVISNSSDSITQNLLQAYIRLNIAGYTKKPETKAEFIDKYNESCNKIVATVRKSVVANKNVAELFSKENEKQLGIYSLYIPDNSLGYAEIKIPNPKNVGINVVRTEINGNTVVIMHNCKTVIIDGPDADNMVNKYSTGRFNGYVVYKGQKALNTLKPYPAIGDYVIATRHPITTLMIRCKVVGYTDDGSIRANILTCLALQGDADGDSWSVSWSKWSDQLLFADNQDVLGYADAAGIKIRFNKFDNKWDINHFLSLKPETAEECFNKSAETGMEQAEAKIKTKKLTGLFGAIDRDIVQTFIINKVKPTFAILKQKADISQMLVQLKNILKDLSKGKLSDAFKESFVAIYHMKGKNTAETSQMLAQLLDKSNEESLSMIEDWVNIQEDIEEIREEQEDIWKDFI